MCDVGTLLYLLVSSSTCLGVVAGNSSARPESVPVQVVILSNRRARLMRNLIFIELGLLAPAVSLATDVYCGRAATTTPGQLAPVKARGATPLLN